METKRILLISIIVIAIIVIGSIIFLNSGTPYKNTIKCKNDCIADGWEEGMCDWPNNMDEDYWQNHVQKEHPEMIFPYKEIENRGSCIERSLFSKSKHCGNDGQCNCYCFNYNEGVPR
jgi:hypothetical protein